MNKILIIVFALCMPILTVAQIGVTTAGFQFKPIFKNDFLRTADKTITEEGVDFKVGTQNGFAAGMVVRHGISNRFSFETGINYVKRNYELSITDSAFNSVSDFRIIGYEIPAMGMVFIRLGEEIFMNVSMGLSVDLFPSNIFTEGERFEHYSVRNHIVNSGVHSNIGWEYRTKESGMIYLGASYHRPFQDIYISQYNYNNKQIVSTTTLDGSYFTVDLRYFFHGERDDKTRKKR